MIQLSQVLVMGLSAPDPDLLFVLKQKVSKKLTKLKALRSSISKQVLYCFYLNVLFKTSAALLEKLAFGRLKSSKLVEVRPPDCKPNSEQHELQLQTRTILNRLPLLFFGSLAEVARKKKRIGTKNLIFYCK